MNKKIVIAVIGLLVFCASQSWCGTMGNGSQRQVVVRPYAFCYAGNPNITYISQVIKLTPMENVSNLIVAFTGYIHTTYGLPVMGTQRCVAAITNADAVSQQQYYKKTIGTRKVVEINWRGHSV